LPSPTRPIRPMPPSFGDDQRYPRGLRRRRDFVGYLDRHPQRAAADLRPRYSATGQSIDPSTGNSLGGAFLVTEQSEQPQLPEDLPGCGHGRGRGLCDYLVQLRPGGTVWAGNRFGLGRLCPPLRRLGKALSPEFQVNVTTAAINKLHRVMSNDGHFFIAWRSSQAGRGRQHHLAEFQSRGSPVRMLTAGIPVRRDFGERSDLRRHHGWSPTLPRRRFSAGGGNYVVTWQSGRPGSNNGKPNNWDLCSRSFAWRRALPPDHAYLSVRLLTHHRHGASTTAIN